MNARRHSWPLIAYLAFLLCIILVACLFPLPVHAQAGGRTRAIRPYAFEQFARANIAFTRPLTAADLANLVLIFEPYDIYKSDEIADGYLSVKLWRQRKQSNGADSLCVVRLIPLVAADYTQWFAYQPMTWVVPVREGDRLGVELRRAYSLFVPLVGERAECVMCAWKSDDGKLAPGRGFAVPNGGCQ